MGSPSISDALNVTTDEPTVHDNTIKQARQDALFRRTTQLFAVLVLGLLAAIVVSLVIGAAPAFHKFGLHFITGTEWNPVTEEFGGFVPIFGTLVTSAVALLHRDSVELRYCAVPDRAVPRVAAYRRWES